MRRREKLVDFFRFSRKERIGLLVIALLILVGLWAPSFMSAPPLVLSDTSWMESLRSLEEQQSALREVESKDGRAANQWPGGPETGPKQVFFFDPNKLDSQGWARLGLPARTIQTILRYRLKGGRFRKDEDLQRLYGLRKDDYERLRPYVRIEPVTENLEERPGQLPASPAKSFERAPVMVDVNAADTSAFIALPGIGSKLAARIVAFREKLGGFYAVEQIREVYGLSDSTFKKIASYLQLTGASAVRRININLATADEMKSHPYIKSTLANAIVAYRKANGSFGKAEDLLNIMSVTEDMFAKLRPYIDVDQQ